MRIGKAIIGVVPAILLLASAVHADTIVQIATYSCTTGCNSADWHTLAPTPGTSTFVGTGVPNGSSFITALAGTDYVRANYQDTSISGQIYDQGSGSFPGGTCVACGSQPTFSAGEFLLSTNNGSSSGSSPHADALTLTFTNTISEFGIIMDDEDYSDPYIATISSNLGGNFSVTSTGTNGGAIFIGLMDNTGANISSITITTTCGQIGGCSSSNHGTPDFFMLGTADFDEGISVAPPPPTTSTPEPASLLMMAGGIAAVALKLRKRARA